MPYVCELGLAAGDIREGELALYLSNQTSGSAAWEGWEYFAPSSSIAGAGFIFEIPEASDGGGVIF